MARVARKGARIVLGALLRRTHYINLLLLLVAGFYAVDILSTGFLLFLFSFAVSPALAERAWPVLLAYEILAFFAFYSFHAIYRSPTAFDPPSHFGKLRSETLGLRTYDTTWSLLPYVALITCSLAQWAVYRMLRARREENQRKREIRRQLLACTQQPHRSLSDFRVGEPVVHCVRGQGRVDLIDAEESRIAIRFLEDGERHFYDAEKLHDGRLQPAAPTAPLTSPDGRLSRGSIQTEDAEEAAAKRLHLRRMRYQMKFVASLLLGYGFYVGIALFSSLTMISAVYMLFLIALTLIVAFSSNRAKWLTTVWVTTIVYSCAAMVVMYMYQFVSLREPFADVVNAVLDCDNAAPTMTLPVQSGTAALHDGDDSSSWKLRTQCMNQLGLRTFGDDSFAGMKSRALAMLPHYAAFAIALYQLKILPSVTSSSELERAGGGLGQAARGSKRVIVIGAPYLLAGLLFVASTHGYGNDHEGSLLSAGYFLFAVWHSFTMLSHAHAAVFFTVCVLLLKFWVQFKTFPHAWFSERSLRYFGLERICEHDDVERCKKSMADTVWWDMLAFLAAMLQHQSRVWLATMAESEFLCASAMRSQLTLVSYDSAEGGAEGEQGEVTSRPQDAPASPQSPRRPFVPVWLSGAVQRGLRRCAFAIDFGFTLYGFEAVMLVLLIVAVARPFRVYALCFAVMLLAWRNSRLSYSHAHALNASAQGLGIANATLALLFCTLQQALFVGLPEATVDSIGVPFAACEDNSARCKHLRYFALYPVADDLWACFAVFFVTVRFCVVHREVSAPGYRGHGRIDRAALCAQYDGAVTLAAYLDSGHREELLELLATPEVQLRRPRPGMYIRMVPAAFETPTGSVQLHEAYSGQVVSADGTDMVILWNDPTDGGPPWRVTGQDFPRRRVEPQDWWSSGGRPRRDALRDLAGILPRPLRGHNFIVHPRGITDRVRALWMMALPGLIILLIFIDSTRNEYVTVFRAGKLFGALYLTVAWGDLKWRGDRVWYYMNSYYILLLFLHLVWEVPGAADQQQAGVQLVGFASHDGGPVRTDALEVVIMSLMYLQRVNMDSFDFVYVLWEAFLHELHARDNAERCAAVRKQRKRLALERQLEAAQDRDENLRRTRQLVSALERELCDAVAGDTDAMNVSRPGNNLRSKVRFDLMPTWYEHPDDVSPRRAASPDPPSPPSPKPHVPPLVFPVVVTPAPVGRCTSSGAQQLTTPDVTFTASDPDVVTALEQVSPRAPPGGSAAGDDDEAADTMPMVHTRLAQRIGGRSMDQADGIGDLRRRHTRAAAAAAALVAATAGAVSQTPLAVRAAISVQRKALLGRRDLHPAHPDMRRGSLFAWGIALDGMLLLAIEETHLICATIFAVNFAVSASFADLIPSAASFVYALVANPGPNRMWWTFCLIWYTTVLFVKCILQALSLTVISKSAGTDSEAVRWLFGHLSQTFFENVLFDFFAIVSIFVHCHCLAWMGQGLDAVRQKHHRVVSDAGSGSDSDTAENRSRESFARSRSRASTRLSGPSQAARTARSGAISIASTKVMRQLQFGKLLPWNWSPRAAAIAFAHFVTATMSPHRRKSQLETQDLHTLCMGLDFLVFLLFAAFYSILQGQSGFKIASDISQNLVPGPLVLICFGLFLSILTERVIYLTKSIRAKCVSQLVQVLLFHLAYFLWWNETALTEGAHAAGAILFLVKALWLGLSAYQIRTGYPDPTEGNQDCFTMRPLSYFWGFLYMILRAIPLVWEFRVILDWCAANTTLSMKEWLQLEDVRYELYITRQTIRDKQVSNPHIGSATPFVDKVLGGWSIVAGLSLLVFFPLMYYSSFSPLLHSNTVSEISLSLRFDNTPPFYSERLLVPPEKRYKNETFAQALANTRNSARKLEVTNDDKKVQLLQLSANSAELWPITRPAVNNLADLLNSATPPAIIATVEVTRTSGDPAALDLRESSSYRLDLPWRNDTRERLVHVIATANTNGTAEAILPGFFSPWFLSRPLTLEINNTMPYQDCLLGINSSGAEGSTFWSFRCRSLFRHGNEPSPDDVPGDYDRGDPGCSAPECFPYVPAYGVAVSDLVNDTNGFLAGIGIVAFYVTFVLAVGRVIRDAATGGSHFIPLRCMANPLPVAMLAEHVHLARRAGDRELEEELWTLLVNLLRSPETVLRLTGLRGRRFAPRANPRI